MRVVAPIALAAFLIFPSCLSSLSSTSYYALELRGGSRSYSLDRPVRRGRLVLFHRYPDGVYLSLAAEEVERIVFVETAAPPRPEGQGLAPGETLFIGPAVEGPGYQAPPPAEAPSGPPPGQGFDWGYGGYGYTGWWWGGSAPPRPHPGPPRPSPPALVGPNGFPILAPPGSPGSQPLPIGPNGYPILAPQPAPAPRHR
jgi:hypothetical protein